MRLLLLPGLNGSNRLFAPLLACLPENQLVECLELPEHGPQDYPRLADGVLPRLGNAPFVLLGESFSGPLARELATRKPQGLQGVIFAATFVSRPNPLLRLVRYLPQLPPSVLARRKLIRQFCVGHEASEVLVNLVVEEIRSMPARLARTRLETLADLNDSGSPLSIPCLNLLPLNDRLVTLAARQGVVAGCANIRTIEIAGPHFLLQSKAQRCATAILDFLNELA